MNNRLNINSNIFKLASAFRISLIKRLPVRWQFYNMNECSCTFKNALSTKNIYHSSSVFWRILAICLVSNSTPI